MASYKKSKFFVRLLPTEDVDWENIKIETNKEVIHIRCLQDFCFTNKLSVPRFWSFKTDGIFYNTDQETVYHVVMDGIIQSVFDGLNIVIMACGQTCSGKSFTLGALRSMYEYRGIIPRFITDIFSEIAMKKKEWKVNVSMSSIEILGNTIYDLMASPDTPCNIKKISVTDVHSEKEALALMFKGEEHRRHAPDAPYLGANITNCIITFHFDCLSLIRSNAVLNRSKVHFVDLAGIETVGKRGATSFKEANVQGIANKAKSNLEQVLHNMTKLDNYHTSSHVKRLCRLTEYLSAAFTKGSILRFIVHIRPTFDDLEVSHSALKLGLNMKQIPVASLTHLEPSTELMFRNIKDELNQLKEQILVEKLLSGSSEVQNCNFSQAQLAHLERLAAAYLQGWSSEVNVLGNNEHVITLKVFKEMFSKENKQYEKILKELQQQQQQQQQQQHMELDRKSRANRTSKIFKADSFDSDRISFVKGKQNSKDVSKKTRLSSKSPAVQPSKVPPLPPTTLSIDKDMTNDDGNISLNTAPEISQKKVWEEFLAEQNINLKYLEELTNSVKKKKIAYELATEEYNQTRINLERNRLNLKEIAWKRQSGNNELYDRFGQVVITEEERTTAKLVSSLEFAERSSKTLLDTRYTMWKEASKEFLQEKLKLEEKYKDYCNEKYNVYIPPAFDNNDCEKRESVKVHLSEPKKEKAKKYYNYLQKKLKNKSNFAC